MVGKYHRSNLSDKLLNEVIENERSRGVSYYRDVTAARDVTADYDVVVDNVDIATRTLMRN